jgi:hypothetical protein
MKRSHLLLLTAAASIALLLVVIAALLRNSDPVLAAPRPVHDPLEELLGRGFSPLYQADEISCTLTSTTTDSLNNTNACAVGTDPATCANRAVSLASYSNLALVAETDVPEDQEIDVPVHTDWFRLDNAQIGSEYTVEALPDRTTNYNLGIIVYDLNRTPIITDADSVDNNRALVTVEAENQGPYFFQVFQLTPACAGLTYDLEASSTGPTATPTPTELPTAEEDEYEPNENFDQAPTLPIQVPILLELTFHSEDDRDYFQFYTKDDRWFQASTSDLDRVDTILEIYDRDKTRIERNDDGGGGLASKVSWKSKYDGYYFIVVQNNVNSTGSYNLTIEEISAPTPGPSPTPGVAPTPRGRADDCEPNMDFEEACVIPLGAERTFNFVPPFGEGPDNDFYKVWVKPNLHYRCQTSDLAPGVDPNMIVFRGPSWDAAVGGNDDIESCNFNSSFSFFSDYAGWLYLLIGTGDRTPSDIFDSNYTLLCEKSTTPFLAASTRQPTAIPGSGKLPTPMPTPSPAPGTRTPTPTRTATPTPTPTSPGSPIATPTEQAQAMSVRRLTTPVPASTPRPRFLPINILVYYDANGDGQRGAGEGIAGISARAYDVATNELLAEDYTDVQGNLGFSVSAEGPVRLTVPFLGLSHLVVGEEASIQVRVPPQSGVGGAP